MSKTKMLGALCVVLILAVSPVLAACFGGSSPVSRIEVRQQPTNTVFTVGNDFNSAGLQVYAVRENNTYRRLNARNFTLVRGEVVEGNTQNTNISNLTEADRLITVKHTAGGETFTVGIPILVRAAGAPELGAAIRSMLEDFVAAMLENVQALDENSSEFDSIVKLAAEELQEALTAAGFTNAQVYRLIEFMENAVAGAAGDDSSGGGFDSPVSGLDVGYLFSLFNEIYGNIGINNRQIASFIWYTLSAARTVIDSEYVKEIADEEGNLEAVELASQIIYDVIGGITYAQFTLAFRTILDLGFVVLNSSMVEMAFTMFMNEVGNIIPSSGAPEAPSAPTLAEIQALVEAAKSDAFQILDVLNRDAMRAIVALEKIAFRVTTPVMFNMQINRYEAMLADPTGYGLTAGDIAEFEAEVARLKALLETPAPLFAAFDALADAQVDNWNRISGAIRGALNAITPQMVTALYNGESETAMFIAIGRVIDGALRGFGSARNMRDMVANINTLTGNFSYLLTGENISMPAEALAEINETINDLFSDARWYRNRRFDARLEPRVNAECSVLGIATVIIMFMDGSFADADGEGRFPAFPDLAS